MMRIPKQGHLIPWERPDLIRDAIVRLLDGERAKSGA
jgi:pimeloyl-ACP methyl ester carboxylesterase